MVKVRRSGSWFKFMFSICGRAAFISQNLYIRAYKHIITQNLKCSRHFEVTLLVGEDASSATTQLGFIAWRAQSRGQEEPRDFLVEVAEENLIFVCAGLDISLLGSS